ncbi:hypothetical protein JMJ58_22420 (plasmid) [Haloterrigena salifodinae]|uniref:Uncharacterized protein n=2 Tax=Haloterrigena salifodinae TaxID=2675099 RepID=A0A8T8E7M9_9EURY|nr:hypothetical protein JMJ58_22420 [Haloterrigena salifodinae]
MEIRSWLQHSKRIARTELVCHFRKHNLYGNKRQIIFSGVLLSCAIVLGLVSYSLGRNLASGHPIPTTRLLIGVSLVFILLLSQGFSLLHTRFEHLELEMLLTTVPVRTAALGLQIFVWTYVAILLALPVFGVAVGTALGLRSPTVASTIIIAIASLATLATTLGVVGRLIAYLIGRHLARGNFYRDFPNLFGWTIVLGIVILFWDTLESVIPLIASLGSLSLSWIIDLALFGAGSEVNIEPRRGLIALGVIVPTILLLEGIATVLIRRIWETEPVTSTGNHSSHTLVGGGRLEQLLGDHVSQPVLTVARERWLMERRAPNGLLYPVFIFLFAIMILLPLFSLIGIPLLLLVVLSFGLGTGIIFGLNPIGNKYRVLPMLFTTVNGRQFVSGLLLATVVVSVPVVTVAVFPISVISSVNFVGMTMLVVVGVALCACTASINIAVGMGVKRREFGPVPALFTEVPAYAEMGWAQFIRLGATFVGVSLVGVPAYLGNLPSVYESAGVIGIPIIAVRLGSLLLTTLIAAVVTKTAYQIAVQRYQDYQME